jgi:hypothetical protein
MSRKKIAVGSAAEMVIVDGQPMLASEYEASLPPEVVVTVLEPGLAQGLDAKATENAKHAMGVEETPIDQAILDAARAPKERKLSLPKVPGIKTRADGSFGARSTHEGKFLMATEGKYRKAGDPGAPGLEWLHDEYVVSYETFASQFPINHLNWDINRGWVKLISKEEADELLGTDEEPAPEAEPEAEQPAEEPAGE